MAHDLVSLAADAVHLSRALGDPATAPASIQSALAAVRTLHVHPGRPGPPAPNLDLLAPSAGVPRPAAVEPVQDAGAFAIGAPAVSLPLPMPGPAGPTGELGPVGPIGPPGPGVDPARVRLLEQAVLDLQEHTLTVLAIDVGGNVT